MTLNAATHPMQAYLVITEGAKWTDVFRLQPGRTATIGRASTNQIVIKDERCSRNHAEVFLTQSQWTLRDLDSRNGTFVKGNRIRGDYALQAGDIVRIAHCQLAFVHDLTQAFAETPVEPTVRDDGEDTVAGMRAVDTNDSQLPVESTGETEAPLITHRRDKTRFLQPPGGDESAIPRMGQDAAKLCRLAFDLASQGDITKVARTALNGLIDSTHVDAGAILLTSPEFKGEYTGTELQILASRSDRRPTYHRVSKFLANSVLHDGEAVLARNVEDDRQLGSQDSKGEIHSTGVICAPLRQDGKIIGLIHLYSTASERTPDPEDLEFTLAVADNLALALRSLSRQQELAENLSLSRTELVQLRTRMEAESELVGSSPILAQLQSEISRAAPSRATVLIRGESGVGKELVARAIHYNSPRKKGPFVCLNCAALSESLLESELFGHERGAFTGATERKIGKFEAAHQGTLMMDEIGEMSSSIQAKFLRVLEGHQFERVGGNQAVKVDVRVIAATNRDLEKAVTAGTFRRDLFFRLRVVEIQVPPLRKRGDDVLALADYFLERFSQETGRRFRGFTPEAVESMRRYRWPGNVRELKNVIERAVVLSRGESIGVEDLVLTSLATSGESGEIPPPNNVYEPLSLEDVERRHIQATLKATGWNKSRAASILGIERTTLDRKIARYQLSHSS